MSWKYALGDTMADTRCLVLDVDGVLTDGRFLYGGCTEPMRGFHVHDGLAIEWFQKLAGPVVILTAKQSFAVETRAAELSVKHVIQGSRDKLGDLKRLLATLEIGIDQVAMVGDDLPDLRVLTKCGYPIAVANAVAEVKSIASYVTERAGGDGAVREAVEHLLAQDGRWNEVVKHYATDDFPAVHEAGRNG